MRRKSASCGCLLTAAAIAFWCVPLAFAALALIGAHSEQNRPDEWFLERLEERLGMEPVEGECVHRVFSSGRDVHLEAAVRLTPEATDGLLQGQTACGPWLETPGDAALMQGVMGAVDPVHAQQLLRALAGTGNRWAADVRFEGESIARFDAAVLDCKEGVLYAVCLDF